MNKKEVTNRSSEGCGSDSTPLANQLKAQILQNGAMTFRDFMAAVLYDSEKGFYTKAPEIGTQAGAFNTNAMFPAFAFALARAIEHAEQLVGEPLRIVEFGGGTGDLATNLLFFLKTPHEYVIVDISQGLRNVQQSQGIQAVESVDHLSRVPTFAFGNEVLDALPVHRVMGNGSGELVEFYVDIDSTGTFIEKTDRPSTPLLAERLQSEGITLGRGQVAEVCLDLQQFLENAATIISTGYLLFIDYGDAASNLYSFSRRNGTLRSFRSQQAVCNPFEAVGDQDLTADVDFTALDAAARKTGLLPAGHLRQGIWLQNIGIQRYSEHAKAPKSADHEIFTLTSPARLGSAFDAIFFKTQGLPDGPGLHPL